MSAVRKPSTILATALLLVGLLAIFVAQRILGEGSRARELTSYAGLLSLLAAFAVRIKSWASARGDMRAVEARLLAAYGGVGASLVLYALSTEWGGRKLALSAEASTRIQGPLSVLWLSAMLVSLFAILFMELVYLRMPIPESIELRRVRTAAHAGLSLALASVFLLSINYVVTVRDVRKDVSYFRTSQPSAATRVLVSKLDKPVRAILFFRQGSDVIGQVKPYFDALKAGSKQLTFEVRDVALSPELASKHKIRENGDVLLLRGEGDQQKAESFHIGDELTEARATLRKLDGNFQQAFTKLARPERVLYLTVGHGERNAKSSELAPEDGTTTMEEILRRLNLKTQDIGLATGLGTTVSPEASALLMIGPSERFMPEEVATLRSYLQKGGKLFLMLDPGKDLGLEPLLDALGIELQPGTVVSEAYHMAHAHNDSDRGVIFSNHYSSHPSVTTASRHQREVATVLVNAVGLKQSSKKLEQKPQVTFPLRSDHEFWRDLNANFQRDGAEQNETLNLMAAVTLAGKQKSADALEGRAVIMGDGDFITDKVARNGGNMLLFVDSLAWLIGNEDLSGETSSEEDIPIEHSREQDKRWFYATTFAVPAPILFVGFWVARRRRMRSEAKS